MDIPLSEQSSPLNLQPWEKTHVVKNWPQNGLKLVLDVESYDYAYFPRGAKGFRVALSAATDQAVINQDGFYISTG
jgi:hypothetical protein